MTKNSTKKKQLSKKGLFSKDFEDDHLCHGCADF